MTITDWDAAYSNRDAVPDHPAIFARWAEQARAYRATAKARLDVPYGGHERAVYDHFRAEGTPRGTIFFIHGGYWVTFDKNSFSHFARALTACGFDVVIPSYALCPEVSIQEIAQQIAGLFGLPDSPFKPPYILSGHSAGGHLAAYLTCRNGPLAAAPLPPIVKAVGMSGLYDLTPLLNTKLNDALKLDLAEARSVSPCMAQPVPGLHFEAVCGGQELDEFRRQNTLLAKPWLSADCHVETWETDGDNHFTILEQMNDPDSRLFSALTSPSPAP